MLTTMATVIINIVVMINIKCSILIIVNDIYWHHYYSRDYYCHSVDLLSVLLLLKKYYFLEKQFKNFEECTNSACICQEFDPNMCTNATNIYFILLSQVGLFINLF